MISAELGELLAARAELVLDPNDPADLSQADAFLASSHRPLSAADLEYAVRLAVVTQVGTAVHVDVAAATRLGIPVLHNRGQNADSVAEHTIALLLAVVKNVVRSDAEVRRRQGAVGGSEERVCPRQIGRAVRIDDKLRPRCQELAQLRRDYRLCRRHHEGAAGRT